MPESGRDLPHLLLPRSPSAIGGMTAAVLNAAMRVAIIPIFVTPVFDRVLVSDDLDALPAIIATAAVVAIVGALALWAQDALLGRAAARVAASWRSGLYRRLLGRHPGTLPGSSGGLASRILTDLREIETYYHYGLGTLVAESVTLVGVVVYLFAANPRATLILIVFALPGFLVLRFVGRRLEGIADRSQAGMESLGGHLQEGLRHHEMVRAFGADDFMLGRFENDNEATARFMARRGVLGGAQVPAAQVMVFIAVGLLVVILAGSVRQGTMTAGETIGYLVLVALLSTPLQLLPKGWAMWLQARAAAKRLQSLAQVPAAADLADRCAVARDQPSAEHPDRVTLHHVVFSYGEDMVLADAHATFPTTGLVAIQGPSGSGKSTLLRLLMGFLSPNSGTVRAYGRPLDEVPEAELRARLGYVPQDYALLSGSVRDNVTLGRTVSDEAVWNALADAGVSDAVSSLPEGLDHRLKEDGTGLSGGQRQRIAIARALVGRPDVLLLDEPTSNLDARSERELVDALAALAERRLVIAVAHRPALADRAAQVYDLHGGRLVRRDAENAIASVPTRFGEEP